MLLALVQAAPIEATTAVSISLLVIVVGAGWRLSGQLARIETRLSELSKLDSLPERFGRVEQKIDGMEREMEALWKELKQLRDG